MSADPATLAGLAAAILSLYPKRAATRAAASPPPIEFAEYKHLPVEFIRDVLGVELTPDQKEIANAVARGGRVKVNSGHNVGKTFLAACLVLWWFYTRENAVVVTTAPTERDVIDLLWTEVRILHGRAKVPLPDYFIGPRAPEMFAHEEHWAKGYTASKGESFQGRHRESMLFVFDECEGVGPTYWETTGTMYKPNEDHAWLAIGNPTTTSSQSYLEDLATAPGGGSKWILFSLSALNHPNVLEELAGRPAPVPNAVSLAQVEQWLQDWADQVPAGDAQPHDVEWPPKSGRMYRPGPSFQSRVMGVRPSSGVDTVWSADAFGRATNPGIPTEDRLQRAWGTRSGVNIGVDPAAFGDDDTAFHVRIGPVSVWHESHNGWGPEKSAAKLKELCREWADFYNALASLERARLDPRDVAATIEGDGGYGVGVHSHRADYRGWRLANAGGASTLFVNGRPVYANLRSQWWCESAKLALAGGVDLSRLPQAVRDRLRIQLLAPFYWNLPSGPRIVEPKKDIKERIKRSPDDADAFIISHYAVQSYSPSVIETDMEDAGAWPNQR